MKNFTSFWTGILLIGLAICLSLLISSPSHAQSSPTDGVVSRNANLRSGPGTTYAVVGSATQGQTVTITNQSEAGDWYELSTGEWIAAFLVDVKSTGAGTALTPITVTTSNRATAKSTANLRGGPGTTYQIVGSVQSGQTLDIVARNEASDWFKLAGGQWIAAFLVNNAPSGVAIDDAAGTQPTQSPDQPTATPAPAQPTPMLVPAQPTAIPAPSGTAKVIIQNVYYDGQVYRVESDEYAVVANVGTAPINIGGWVLNAGDPGQDFRFPGFDLAPGQSVRVYTNENHQESGGFSFGSGRAIWNNGGDCGFLFDAGGNQISEWCY